MDVQLLMGVTGHPGCDWVTSARVQRRLKSTADEVSSRLSCAMQLGKTPIALTPTGRTLVHGLGRAGRDGRAVAEEIQVMISWNHQLRVRTHRPVLT